MIDFNSSSQLSDRINSHIDKYIISKNKKQKPRDYLGGSQIGNECDRALQYSFFNTPPDPDKEFTGQTLRIFQRGHWIEDLIFNYLDKAFKIKNVDQDGEQFGFSLFNNQFQGHCDGVFLGGPIEFGPYPRLWECKGIGDKYFKQLVKDKLKKTYPHYYAQVQIYQKELQLSDNPALFCAVNANTMEIYWEEIKYDATQAEFFEFKAKRVIDACQHGELLPRLSNDPAFFKCKWCNWSERCHK